MSIKKKSDYVNNCAESLFFCFCVFADIVRLCSRVEANYRPGESRVVGCRDCDNGLTVEALGLIVYSEFRHQE